MLGMHSETREDEGKVGSGCFIMNGSKVLMIKRTDNNTWGTPGGNIEVGEHVHAGIIREVKEETGLDVDNVLYLGAVYSFNGENIYTSHIYITRNFSGDIKIQQEECSEYRWVEVKDIWDYDLFIPTREGLDYVDLQYPYLLEESNEELFKAYEGLLDIVKENEALAAYFSNDTQKLTTTEQLVTVRNPGGYGGTHTGLRYGKPGSNTTAGSNLPSKHESAEEYEPSEEVLANQLRQDLLKWFSGRTLNIYYELSNEGNFVFPSFEKMRVDKIVNTQTNYENLFKEQYILYQLAGMEKLVAEDVAPMEEEKEEKESFVEVSKLDKMKKLVYGKVLVPNTVDKQGDYITPEEIEKAAHNFLINLQIGYNKLKLGQELGHDVSQIGYMHTTFKGIGGFGYIAESYIDAQGSWVLVTKITDDKIWKQIVDGVIRGYSIGGKTLRIPRGEVVKDAQN